MGLLKPVSEKDRLYMEMKTIHQKLGVVLREYEAATAIDDRPAVEPAVIDPRTGKPFGSRSKEKRNSKKRKTPAAGSRRQRGFSRKMGSKKPVTSTTETVKRKRGSS